jgi:transposase-like protein
MLKYAGGAICPHCKSSLVHEYDCFADCLPESALALANQRMLCPGCGYSRDVAYVVERRQGSARPRTEQSSAQ